MHEPNHIREVWKYETGASAHVISRGESKEEIII